MPCDALNPPRPLLAPGTAPARSSPPGPGPVRSRRSGRFLCAHGGGCPNFARRRMPAAQTPRSAARSSRAARAAANPAGERPASESSQPGPRERSAQSVLGIGVDPREVGGCRGDRDRQDDHRRRRRWSHALVLAVSGQADAGGTIRTVTPPRWRRRFRGAVGSPNPRAVGPSRRRRPSPQATGPPGCQAVGLSGRRAVGPSDHRTLRPSGRRSQPFSRAAVLARANSASSTGSSQVTCSPSSSSSWEARWAMKASSRAPCQCSSSGGIHTV